MEGAKKMYTIEYNPKILPHCSYLCELYGWRKINIIFFYYFKSLHYQRFRQMIIYYRVQLSPYTVPKFMQKEGPSDCQKPRQIPFRKQLLRQRILDCSLWVVYSLGGG